MKINGLTIWTAVIAFATIANFWIGINIRDNNESALKLQRAFIGKSSIELSAGKVTAENDSTQLNLIEIRIKFKNFGQIPSKNVKIKAQSEVSG